jgi:hypothetical protein
MQHRHVFDFAFLDREQTTTYDYIVAQRKAKLALARERSEAPEQSIRDSRPRTWRKIPPMSLLCSCCVNTTTPAPNRNSANSGNDDIQRWPIPAVPYDNMNIEGREHTRNSSSAVDDGNTIMFSTNGGFGKHVSLLEENRSGSFETKTSSVLSPSKQADQFHEHTFQPIQSPSRESQTPIAKQKSSLV